MDNRREEYVTRIKEKLDEWNADIDRFSARLDGVADSARKECQEHVEHLTARREDCEAKLRELRLAAESAWEDLKAGVDEAAEAVGSAIRSARERFGRSASAG